MEADRGSRPPAIQNIGVTRGQKWIVIRLLQQTKALCVERVEVEAESVDAAFTHGHPPSGVEPDCLCRAGRRDHDLQERQWDAGSGCSYAEMACEEMLVMRAYLAEHGYTVEKTDAGYRCVNALGFLAISPNRPKLPRSTGA